MHHAQVGDRVRIRYIRLVEMDVASFPLRTEKICEFTVGGTEVLPAISKAVVGMSPGEHRQVTLAPGEAYGEVRPSLIRKFSRTRFPPQLELKVGKRLRYTPRNTGRPGLVTVMEVRPDSIVVNANHPLAGQVVRFDVNLLSLDTSSTANQNKPQRDIGGEG